MTFTDSAEAIDKIKAYIKVPSWIDEARAYHKKQKALIYGGGFKELLLQFQHIETDKKAAARKRYARSIKDVNSKILKPVSNVYSANGGGKEFTDAISEAETEKLLKNLASVRGGYSLERWLETFWSKDLYNVDPSGLMFLEWKDDKAWPTYKSIDAIRYYLPNGLGVEFVIFEPKKVPNTSDVIWRIVDDANDYYILQRDESFSEIIEGEFKTEPHAFGVCPARINSDIEEFGKDYRLAPIDPVIETEMELLSDRSIKTIYKITSGFPTHYRPGMICPTCHGTKKNGIETCTDCGGKGLVLEKDVTDEWIIPISLDGSNQIALPTDFAGFISPDLETWNQYTNEEKLLIIQVFETLWGTRESEEVKDQTATGVILNTQPMRTRLNAWSDIAQSQEWAFTEMLANFYIPTKDKSERVSIITYGRNYIIQPPEFLLKEYQESKKANDSSTILDRKLVEYLTSKYKNDPETLRTELIKKDLEPYVHISLEQVMEVYGQIEAQKKGLFTDWWETLTPKDMGKTKEQLEKDRETWTNNRISQMAIVPTQTNTKENE